MLGGHLDVVMLLIHTHHDIHASSSHGLNMLHFASMRGDYNLIRFLLEAGADSHKVDDDGNTPFDVCKQRRFTKCSELMQKFCLPHPSNKPLVAYWSELRKEERPDSPSWLAREELDATPAVKQHNNSTYVKRNSLILLSGQNAQATTMRLQKMKAKKEAAAKARFSQANKGEGAEALGALNALEGLMKNAISKAGRKKKAADEEPPMKKEFEDLWNEMNPKGPGEGAADGGEGDLADLETGSSTAATSPSKRFSFFSPGKSPGFSNMFETLSMLSPSLFVSPTKKVGGGGFLSSPLFGKSPKKLPPVTTESFVDTISEAGVKQEDDFMAEEKELIDIEGEVKPKKKTTVGGKKKKKIGKGERKME